MFKLYLSLVHLLNSVQFRVRLNWIVLGCFKVFSLL